ncbi:MAG: CHAT domain-containing protein [Chloroflexi bacterium]|nr:CHAT domain-containing protein [Chloroflexota bacterium]
MTTKGRSGTVRRAHDGSGHGTSGPGAAERGAPAGFKDLEAAVQEALSASDVVAWCQSHSRDIDGGFVREVKDRLDAALRSDPRHALGLANLAVASAQWLEDPLLIALAARGKAQALHQTGSTADAVTLYEKASSLYIAAGQEVEGARTLIGAIDALGYLGRTKEALATAERCIETFERRGEHLHRAKVDLNVGNLYHRLERNREASEHYWRARRTFVRYGDRQLTALADTNLGNVATDLCNYRAAHTYYQRAARTLVSLGADMPAAMNEVDIGWLHFIEGDYVRALAILNKAKRLFEEYELPMHVATCNLDLSEIYLLLDNLDQAEQAATDAHTTFASMGHLVDAGRSLMILGALEFRRGNRSRAEQLLKEARDVLARADSEALELTARLELADIYLRSGDAQAALVIASEASQQFERLELRARQANVEIILGRAHSALGNAAEARGHFETALQLGTQFGSQSVLIEANLGLGRLARIHESPEAAIRWLDTARGYVVRVRGILHPEALKTSFVDGKAAVYSDLVEAVLASGGPDSARKAFEIAEESKSQALVDMLAGRVEARIRSNRPEDFALAERVLSLQKELAALHSAVERHENEGGRRSAVLASDLRSRLAELEQELAHKLAELEASSAEYVSLIRPARYPVDDIQRLLPENSALVEYFGVGDGLAAFVVERNSVRAVSIDLKQSALRAAADDLAFDLSRFAWSKGAEARVYARMSESLDRRLSTLYDQLIAPLGALPERLIFVPYRALHLVPLHALRGPEGYLIDRHVVSYAPSAAVLRFCLEKTNASFERVLAIGVTAEHLPYIAREASDVAAQFPTSRLLTGAEASIQSFKRHSTDADVIHIASRGTFRDEKPLFSGVRMSDGWLSVMDAYDLQLDASLVTLSSCQTGAHGASKGDEIVGLVRGFLYAGASGVVTSLWEADDRATAEFMGSFYAALRSGLSRAEALRKVQLETRARLREPYFWAPFVLIGAW